MKKPIGISFRPISGGRFRCNECGESGISKTKLDSHRGSHAPNESKINIEEYVRRNIERIIGDIDRIRRIAVSAPNFDNIVDKVGLENRISNIIRKAKKLPEPISKELDAEKVVRHLEKRRNELEEVVYSQAIMDQPLPDIIS